MLESDTDHHAGGQVGAERDLADARVDEVLVRAEHDLRGAQQRGGGEVRAAVVRGARRAQVLDVEDAVVACNVFRKGEKE